MTKESLTLNILKPSSKSIGNIISLKEMWEKNRLKKHTQCSLDMHLCMHVLQIFYIKLHDNLHLLMRVDFLETPKHVYTNP